MSDPKPIRVESCRPDGRCPECGNLPALEPVSTGCRDTFELMESLDGRRGIVPVDGRQWQIGPDVAPTIAIAICLAYLAAMGKPFEGGA